MRVDLIQPIDNVIVEANASNIIINLFENFDDPFTTGQVAIFEVNNPEEFANSGQIQLLLFDQTGEGAPIATERFVSLVKDGSFDNLIVNRGEVDFVIQAGQFTLDPTTLAVETVPAISSIQGELNPDRSNTQGTIALALSGLSDSSGTDPNSATSQFFFNLSDNSFLDADFTVFGEVLSAEDFEVVEAISNDPVFAPFQDPGELGFIDDSVDLNEVIFFSDISITQQDELTFAATSSNPELVNPNINGGDLTLDFANDQAGIAEVTVEATNLLGNTTIETFSVEVMESNIVPDPAEQPSGFDITFDFRFDTNGFFDTQERRDALEAAADIWEAIIQDEFEDLPVGTPILVTNPQTEESEFFNSDFIIDDLVIFVGAVNQGEGTLASAAPSGSFEVGSTLEERFTGPDFEPWVGHISFNPDLPWFFDPTPNTDNDIPANEYDFLSTALHEIGHVLGFGTSDAFANLIDLFGEFSGANTTLLNDGEPIFLDFFDLAHFPEGLMSDGQETLLDPFATPGTRELPTTLDVAVLSDIGFEIAGLNSSEGEFDTIVVDTLLDEADGSVTDGDASLRDALALIAPGGTISLADGLIGTITLDGTELSIDRDVTINGGGITVDANSASRVFNIDDGDDATITEVFLSNLIVTGGNTLSTGGGIFNSENLVLTNSIISNNTADSFGGGIDNFNGTLTASNSTISGNSALSDGGGIANFNGIVTITNSTISDNTAASGGGIANEDGSTTITNTTIATNSADVEGGGISNTTGIFGTLEGSQVSIANTIVANNIANSGNADLSNATNSPGTISASFSLIEDGIITEDLGGNITGVDPLLDPAGLQDNGGPTQTIALQSNSPAIDAGSNPDDLTTDQRGAGFSRVNGAATDIGAFEIADNNPIPIPTNTLIVDTLIDENDGVNVGGVSLRDALAAIESGGTVTFADQLAGTLSLNGADLFIDRAVSIEGSGDITIDAGGQSRIFFISDGNPDLQVAVNISGLTITGGNAPDDLISDVTAGGGIFSTEDLTLSNSIVTGNVAVSDFVGAGGGIFAGGTLNLIDSTISDNSADTLGGGIGVTYDGANLNLTNSTISGNSAMLGGGISITNSDSFNPTLLPANIANSTISNNSADFGGGIYNYNGQTSITTSTITGNTASIGAGISSYGNENTQTNITSSIVSGNIDADVELTSNFVFLEPTNSFASNGNNLIGDGNAIDAFSGPGDITGNTNPGLAPLADNGGPTQTIALLPGSPAIDAGNNPNNLATDQRGFSRTAGGATDIGAFEAGGVPVADPTDNPDNPDVPDTPTDIPDSPVSDVSIDLDIDNNSQVEPSVDILNIFRVLAGAPQAIVVSDGASVSQQTIAEAVNALSALDLDVDGDGEVVPAVDVLNIFRVFAGAPQAVVIPDGLGTTQQDVVNAVNALIA